MNKGTIQNNVQYSTIPLIQKTPQWVIICMHACLVISDPLRPHGLHPARLLCPWNFPGKNTEVGISSSRGSSQPRDRTPVSRIAGGFFTAEPLGKPVHIITHIYLGIPGGSADKESACNAGDLGSIPGSGRSPGGGRGNPLQYCCLENPTYKGAWQATVHGFSKGWTWMSD